MSTTPDGTMILDQLRASLDGNRYSLSAVFVALAVAFGGSLAVVVLVVTIWHPFKELYAPAPLLKYRLSQFSGSQELSEEPKLSTCVKDSWNLSEKGACEHLGLDAVIYLRALRMTRNIFAVLTVLLFCCAAPININFNLKKTYIENLTKGDALMLLTPSLLSSKQMIPHVVLGWVGNAVVFVIIWYNYRRVLTMRQNLFNSPQFLTDVTHRVLLLYDLPKCLRSREGISRALTQANPRVYPEDIKIGQKRDQMRELVDEHALKIRQFEKLTISENKNKAELVLAEARKIAQQIEQKRNSIGQLNSFGFASYPSIRDVHTIVKKQQSIEVKAAPPPEQIIWRNLKLNGAERSSKQWLVNAVYALLLLLWVVPSALIGCFLSNLTRLGAVWPAFGVAMQRNRVAFAILQGFLAPFVTSAVFAGLPYLFRRFSHMQGKLTRVEREHEVLRKLYAFFFLDNYFVFTVIGVIWDVVAQVLQELQVSKAHGQSLTFKEVWVSLQLAQRIATAIVNMSSFWVMYMLKGIFGMFGIVAQPIDLLLRLGQTLNFLRKPTPRELAESSLPQPFQYATNFLSILFYVTIALGLTTIQPLVLPIALVMFALAVPLKRYEIINMKKTSYESNGMYWPLVINIILFALAFGNLMLLCVVWVQAGWKIAMGAAPLTITVVIFKFITYFKFDVHYYYPDTNNSPLNPFEKSDMGCKHYEDPSYYRTLDRPLLSFEDALLHCSGTKEKASLTQQSYEAYQRETRPEYELPQRSDKELSLLPMHDLNQSYGSVDTNQHCDSYCHGEGTEYSVGAVRRYQHDNMPYSPIELNPIYQSSDGLVPEQFGQTRSKTQDHQWLLDWDK